MGLVDYSDSETSDVEDKPAVKATAPPKLSKPAFTKVVDRSNPGKIKISLPQATSSVHNGEGPPPKRVKTNGSGMFGGFNSFLPPPKRTGQTAHTTLGGGKGTGAPSIGAKINFKTGSAPAFDRGSNEYEVHDASDTHDLSHTTTSQDTIASQPADEVKLVGKPTMFRPLSVSRKPTKKKSAPVRPSITPSAISVSSTPVPVDVETPKPKISLFSMASEKELDSQASASTSQDYEPLIYSSGKNHNGEDDVVEESQEFTASYKDFLTPNASQMSIPPAAPTPPVSQSLSDIAGDLNLSVAERRQLFGRQKGGDRKQQSATKIINFNTDQEYLHNEELRAAGEQVVHNPVRAIAPGKHSLKQLVNAAQSQREALEESFAKGKSNRAEASSRYGW